MHGIEFLQDLAVIMIVAGIVTIVFHQLKQPVVLGYIVAGLIIGPHTPPWPLIHGKETIEILAELGVILLMFALGLEFSLRKLKQVGASAFIAAFAEILLMLWIGYELGRLFGWKTMDSIFLGAILSISSTTIIIKALNELGKAREPFAQLIFAILIIEDILGIALIALLSGIGMTGSLQVSEVGTTLGKLSIFLVVVLVIGLLTVPRLMAYVARFRSNEMILVTALGLCFGVSLLAVKLGYSAALGAFVIGAVVAEAREIHRIVSLVEPVRDMFSAIFFVAIGLLLDPAVILEYWMPILVLTVAVVVGKVISCSIGAFAGGNDRRSALRVGMGLAQIGEFSFIIASLGLSLGVTSSFLYPIAVAVSVLTTLFTPYLIQSTDPVVNWLDRITPKGVIHYLETYTRWFGQVGSSGSPTILRKFIRRSAWQIALNCTLICGIFIAASFVSVRGLSAAGLRPGEFSRAVFWFGAAALSLPLIIASYRKIQAIGMLLGEVATKRIGSAARARTIQAILSGTIAVAGAMGLGLLVLVLSSALLPSLNVLLALVAVLVIITFLLWRKMVKVYSRAQVAMAETFAETALPHEYEAPRALPTALREAKMEVLTVSPDSEANGKLIRELALRTRTGASVVAIERAGANIINPDPNEELAAGDQIVLLGNEEQVNAARPLFAPDAAAAA